MKPGQLLLPAVGLISLAAGALLFNLWQPTRLPSAPTATPAEIELHSIPLAGIDGRQTLLSDWQSEILIINFWAPWCAPCRREIPALIEIQSEYADRSVRVLGLAFDGAEPVKSFAEEYGIDYPLFLVENRSTMYNVVFSNPSGSLPYTALLSPDRSIVYQHNGEVSAQQLRELLEAHLSPQETTAN